MLHRIASSIAESLVDLGKEKENLEESNDKSIGHIGDFDAQYRDNKHYMTFNNNYTDKMAMIIKIGTGGDKQSHVLTPRSIKEKERDIEITDFNHLKLQN
jgi:hypothetical protein